MALRQVDRPTMDVLRELGLTEYEARVYVSSLRGGSLLVRDLAYESGVPRTKAYATAKSLSAKGLVRLRDNPLRCIPVDIEEAFGDTIKQEERRVREVKGAIAKIKKMRQDGLQGRSLAEGRYNIYVAQDAVIKLGELVAQAQFSFHAMVDAQGLSMLQRYRKEMAALGVADCEVEVVASYREEECLRGQLDLPYPVRVGRVSEGKNIFIVDRSVVFVGNGSTGSAMVMAFPDMAGLLDLGLFQPCWESALDLSRYLRASDHGLATEFPGMMGDRALLPFLVRSVASVMGEQELRRLAVEFYERVASGVPSHVFTLSPEAALPAWAELVEASLADRGKVRYDDVTKMMTIELAERDLAFPDSAWLLAFMGYLEKNGMPLRVLHRSESPEGMIFQAKITWNILN